MQKILHSDEYRALSPIFNDMEWMYALTSEKTLQSQNALLTPVFDNAFKDLQSLFNQYGGCAYNFDFMDKQYKPISLPQTNRKNVVVLFSGGKDSTALAVKLQSNGYNVYLYHVKNINRSYPDEWKHAQKIADYLGMPIYFDEIKLSGKLGFIEHPMKNMIIANRALQWAIKNKITTNIAAGNYYTGELSSSMFYICGDDFKVLWNAYEKIIRRIIPSFRVWIELESVEETISWVASDLNLLSLCQSCLGAQRFRQWNHDNNEKKYGIKLLDNRCGSCWKCCVEYIYLADSDLMEYNEGYYIHCLDVLKKTDKKENGRPFIDIQTLWDNFMFYDIQESKYHDILNYGRHR